MMYLRCMHNVKPRCHPYITRKVYILYDRNIGLTNLNLDIRTTKCLACRVHFNCSAAHLFPKSRSYSCRGSNGNEETGSTTDENYLVHQW
ncbi:hypothetical protein BDR03DRAFT_641026 [Suillus americanus]|nr:hypothetical protein BDR03DRAFT_641026 [Suillus americanus]